MAIKSKTAQSVATPESQAAIPEGAQQNLYMSVKTVDAQGKSIGERLVDLYHYNTATWMRNHMWWARHHEYTVSVTPATADEFLAFSKNSLAAKYNDGTIRARAA
jgi:hypothetical protein